MKTKTNLAIISLAIILLFTGADWVGHQYLQTHNYLQVVPAYYYTNKIIFGTILLFASLLIIKIKDYKSVFLITAIIVGLLQTRYLYIYNQKFNITVMILHYVILAPLLYIAQKYNYI